MKKSTGNAGYQPLPNRPTSPLDRPGAVGSAPTLARRPATGQPAQPTTDARRPQRLANVGSIKPIAPGQPAAPGRVRERFISLPDELQESDQRAADLQSSHPTIFEDLPEESTFHGIRGRITIYCIAESLDRKALELRLRERGSNGLIHTFPDVLYGQYETYEGADLITGDVFYFDYGVLVMWGLTEAAEREVIRSLAGPALVDPLPPKEVEVDEFKFHYTMHEKPHIQNDTFTINYRLAKDHLLKLSISHALAQSTKLTVYEERVVEIVESTKELPVILATTGTVKLSRKSIAQLIGRVFLQKSAVNLLSTVLDTPEFFWSAPDAMQSLYKRVCDYVEYDARVEVLNSRFQVLQEMLDMLRDHQNNGHGARLEWIVIWLIVVEVVVGLFECASILGWVG